MSETEKRAAHAPKLKGGARILISVLAQYLSREYTAEDFTQQQDMGPDLVREVYRQKFGNEDEPGRGVPV